MKQIRKNVFETNSSSTHSLTMCSKDEFDMWVKGELLLNDGGGYGSDSELRKKQFLTYDEAVIVLRSNKYTSPDLDYNDKEAVLEALADDDIMMYDKFWERHEDLESFERTYKTAGGEEVVAFGYYGYDG